VADTAGLVAKLAAKPADRSGPARNSRL